MILNNHNVMIEIKIIIVFYFVYIIICIETILFVLI